MELTGIFSLLGGLALFLYGMSMMSNGLEQAAGDKMKTILEKLTTNRLIGVIVGALITAVIQSSSATTVMTVGFVNAGLMQLQNAVWIIMGANIGTTITGQLVVVDVSAIAPLIAFIGVGAIVFLKNKKIDMIGMIIAGLGILFMGMDMMSDAMMPLRDSQAFVSLVSTFQNPIIGIVVGAVFTAIIQSSSASVGILIALAKSGVINLPQAIYVLFGQNIGTCITALLASIGANRNAKRTTIIHLSFNIIGTIFFVIISLTMPFASWVAMLTPNNVPAQIANVHTIFNIVTTLLLLPFGSYLVKLSFMILPAKDEKVSTNDVIYLDKTIFDSDHHLGAGSIVVQQLFNETKNMLSVAHNNIDMALSLLMSYSEDKYELIAKQEDYVDYLNKEIIEYTTMALSSPISLENANAIGMFIKTASDLERISDHGFDIAKRAKRLAKNNESFSKTALYEIKVMQQLLNAALEKVSLVDFNNDDKEISIKSYVSEIEDRTHEFAYNQLYRLQNKQCNAQNSALYTETLIDIKRAGEHGDNIVNAYYQIKI